MTGFYLSVAALAAGIMAAGAFLAWLITTIGKRCAQQTRR